MPIYEIAGKKVQTDKPLSDAEIDEIATVIQGQSASSGTPIDEGTDTDVGTKVDNNFMAEQLSQTPPRTAEQVDTGLPSLENLMKGGLYDSADIATTLQGLLMASLPGEQNTLKNKMELQQSRMKGVGDFLGYDPRSTDSLEGAGGKALFDPTTYLFTPLKGAAMLGSAMSGVGGAMGAKALSDADPDSILATLFGATVGGVAGNAGAKGITSGASAMFGIKPGDAAKAALNAEAQSRVSGFLMDVREANPSFLSNVKDFENISKEVTDFAQTVGAERIQEVSPVLYTLMSARKGDQYIKQALKEDAMIALLDKELKNIKNFKADLVGKFKENVKVNRITQKEPMETQEQITRLKQQKGIERVIENLDYRLSTDLGGIDRSRLGESLDKAIDAAESAARKAMNDKYESLIKRYDFTVEPAAIKELVAGVEQAQLTDIFGIVPREVKKDLSILDSLIQKKESLISGLDGNPIVTLEASKMTPRDIISLKNSLNASARKTQDPQLLNKIAIMQEKFKALRESLPEGFNRELKEVDSEFRARVGIPYSEDATVRSIKGSEFASDITGKMLAKPEAFSSMVEAVGMDEAKQIYRKGMLTRIYDKAIVDDKLNTGKAKQVMKEYREVLRQFPELKDEIDSFTTQKDGLLEQVAKLQAEEKAFQESFANGYFGIITEGKHTYRTVAARMVGREGEEVVRQIENDIKYGRLAPEQAQAVKGAIASELMQTAIDNPDMVKFIEKNRAAFEFALPGQVDKINSVGKYLEKEGAIEKLLNQIPGQASRNETEIGGIPTSSIISTVTNKMISTFHKISVIGSQVFKGQSNRAYTKALNDLLTNPQAMGTIDKMVKAEAAGELKSGSAIKKMATFIGKTMAINAKTPARETLKALDQQFDGEEPEIFEF